MTDSGPISLEFLRRRLAQVESEAGAPLQFGGGGGTSGGMDVVDAKIAAAEARTDTKFTQVLSRLDNIDGDIGRVGDNAKLIIQVVIGTGLTILAVGVAIFGWGSSMFGTGMNVQTAIDRSAEQFDSTWDARTAVFDQRLDALNARFEQIDDKLTLLLKTPSEPPSPAP